MKRIKSKHTYISIYRFIQTAIMNCISTLPHATASRAHAVKITKLRLEKSQAKKKKKTLDSSEQGQQRISVLRVPPAHRDTHKIVDGKVVNLVTVRAFFV